MSTEDKEQSKPTPVPEVIKTPPDLSDKRNIDEIKNYSERFSDAPHPVANREIPDVTDTADKRSGSSDNNE